MPSKATIPGEQEIILPAFHEWRWPKLTSPHLAEIDQECLKWSAAFTAFDDETQRLIHDKGKLNLLSAMCYARMTRDEVISGCQLMHLFFMFDEYSDISSPEDVQAQAQAMIDCMDDPSYKRPDGQWIGAEIARQFWLALPASPSADIFRRRFRETWVDYVFCVVEQALYRSEARILDPEDYLRVRRHTTGALSTFAFYELTCAIPDDIRAHPIICELEVLAVDLIVIVNDVLSYNKEQAVGDDQHNLVTILMYQRNIGVQEAIDEAGQLSDQKMSKFYELYTQVPRYIGPVDLDVQKLIDGIAQCVSGVIHWSYESQRYFGTKGLQVKQSGRMRLLPKVKGYGATLGSVPVDDASIV